MVDSLHIKYVTVKLCFHGNFTGYYVMKDYFKEKFYIDILAIHDDMFLLHFWMNLEFRNSNDGERGKFKFGITEEDAKMPTMLPVSLADLRYMCPRRQILFGARE